MRFDQGRHLAGAGGGAIFLLNIHEAPLEPKRPSLVKRRK